MKRVMVILTLLLTAFAFSWSGHDALTYIIVSQYEDDFDAFVEITPYTYSDVDTQQYNPAIEGFYDYLGEDYLPEEDLDLYSSIFPNPKPVDNLAPLWQILSVYSYEPDLGMDKGLELKGIETLLGDSQGLRHMEYRMFFFVRVGKVTDVVQYFSDLAEIAYSRGDHYWAYRFLGRALHYLEDVGQPFHTFPAPFFELLKLPFNMDKWLTVFANYHFAYDFYGGYLLWEEYEPLVEAIKEVSPKEIKDPKQAAVSLRRYSRNRLSSVYYELKRTMGDKLENPESAWPGKAYFDDLQDAGETAKLDALSVEILRETASYVKGYINYMLARFAEIDSES
ncbi:MAG: phospholipase [Mesotoga sp.]|uniref:phospholipase n=1 Tax=Mesotoga sp. TaxID=2053577 RepID=UPI00262387EB|nr:phospholipase [Mesotoga sp.]MDD4826122.1 phospholipase [Mesotoga sp.]MDD5682415.1 phospholipase [Mesotoga sp.]